MKRSEVVTKTAAKSVEQKRKKKKNKLGKKVVPEGCALGADHDESGRQKEKSGRVIEPARKKGGNRKTGAKEQIGPFEGAS